MRTLFGLVAIAFLITSCAAPGPGQPLNVLVLGQSEAGGSVTRRVSRSMASAISDSGHKVYDETLATLDDFAPGGRLSRAELLDVARSVSPPIDVAVVYTLTSSMRDRASSREVRISIEAAAIDVSGGRTHGSSSSSDSFRVAPNCQDICLRESIGDAAVKLAASVGGAMATKLGPPGRAPNKEAAPGGLDTAFEIKLDGFATREARDIEDSLTQLKGYRDHRIQFSNNRRLDLWYETKTSASKINKALDNIFDALGVRANVQFSGNTFKVTRVTPRPKESVTETKDWTW